MISGKTRFIGLLISLMVAFLFSSCGVGGESDSSSELAEQFYEYQMPGAEPLPLTLFPDEETRDLIESRLLERQISSGTIISRRKIGSNKMVSLGDQGRIDKVTFIFEVECESGMARETLVLQRTRGIKGYKIVSYHIENVGKMKEQAPMSTTSA